MIDVKDIITLSDNNKYIVMARTEMDTDTYFYLLDSKDYTNYKFVLLNKETNDSLYEVRDQDTLKQLIKLIF